MLQIGSLRLLHVFWCFGAGIQAYGTLILGSSRRRKISPGRNCPTPRTCQAAHAPRRPQGAWRSSHCIRQCQVLRSKQTLHRLRRPVVPPPPTGQPMWYLLCLVLSLGQAPGFACPSMSLPCSSTRHVPEYCAHGGTLPMIIKSPTSDGASIMALIASGGAIRTLQGHGGGLMGANHPSPQSMRGRGLGTGDHLVCLGGLCTALADPWACVCVHNHPLRTQQNARWAGPSRVQVCRNTESGPNRGTRTSEARQMTGGLRAAVGPNVRMAHTTAPATSSPLEGWHLWECAAFAAEPRGLEAVGGGGLAQGLGGRGGGGGAALDPAWVCCAYQGTYRSQATGRQGA